MLLRHKTFALTLAAMLALGFAGDAFARAGSGGSFGSRGGQTFSAPPITSTAPRGASPIQRSMTSPNQNIFRPDIARSPGGLFSGGFGRGFFGGLMGGLLGAGLFGLLFGHGLFGGLGGGFSILGLLIQIGLLYLVFKLVMGFIRNRQLAFPGAAFRGMQGGGAPPMGGFGGSSQANTKGTPIEVTQADFNAFEQRLAAVQAAYSAEDLDGLRRIVTPEMASYFAEEIAGHAMKGVVNKVANVKLLQGDLAEAWKERDSEYATVAMRFSLIDTMLERASGRVVSGDPSRPEEVTEVWTFVRRVGGTPADWKLSAIQQG
jgi:predicted lipid-binding transport protein (Tim44 family)